MTYDRTELLEIDIPEVEDVDPRVPFVFDDHSLAFNLGIRGKTLWWLLTANNYKTLQGDKPLYKRMEIPKSSGGTRVIHEPCPALKNVQKAILSTFFVDLEAPEHIGAYVPGRGLMHTIERHVGHAVLLSTDIRDFYGNTRRSWIRNWLRTFGYNEWVVKALSNLVVIPQKASDGNIYSVLPQGAPTSGLVANFVAGHIVDKPVLEYLESVDHPFTYTRYSDNIEVSSKRDLSFEDMDEVRDNVLGIINGTGYRTRPDKTYITRRNSPDYAMRVLGMTVNEKPNIPRQKYRHLRAIVHNCATKGFDTQYERAGYENAMQMYDSIKGKLIWWKPVAPHKINPLLEKLKEAGEEQSVI